MIKGDYMKKLTIYIIVVSLLFLSLTGCNKNKDAYKNSTNNEIIDEASTDYVSEIKKHFRNKDNEERLQQFEINEKFKEVVENSKRLNVLILGTEEEARTDTIMLASFDPKTKKADLISVPRDTYYHKPGYDTGDHRKINAALPRGGYEDILEAVENTLKIPVDHYVRVRYSGVKAIVNMIGGVEVYVPFDMEKSVPSSPNYINLKKGRQVLTGDTVIQFLRFRKGNEGKESYKNGDLGRIQAQQQFVKSAIRKTLGFNLVKVIPAVFRYKYVATNLNITDIVYYATKAVGINMDDISMATLPGESKYLRVGGRSWSYFVHDEEKTKELIYDLYDFESVTD